MAKKRSEKTQRGESRRQKLLGFLKSRKKIGPHKSFRRSYREDYERELEVPGIMYHVMASFREIFRNWKLFLPLLIIAVVLNAVFVGIMDEASYTQFQDIMDVTSEEVTGGEIGGVAKAGLLLVSTVTTGGLSGESSEAAVVFGVLIFLILWLVTIFLLRHRLADHEIKLRDGLYNAMAPLISTFLVFVVADGLFGDSVLCFGVLCLCGIDDIAFGVLAVGHIDGASGSECTRAVSDEGAWHGFGANDGATREVPA